MKCLPYYVLERTEECRLFFYKTEEGYFNFWNKLLVMKTKGCEGTYLGLVNRTNKKFNGNISNVPIEEMIIEYNKSIVCKEPKQMFIDFPELGATVN